MTFIRNPQAKTWRQLGHTAVEWQAAHDAIVTYMTTNDDKPLVDEATVRTLHPILADDKTWNQVKAEMGL